MVWVFERTPGLEGDGLGFGGEALGHYRAWARGDDKKRYVWNFSVGARYVYLVDKGDSTL